MPLSNKQMEYLALAWQCFESEPKIDYEKFREVANLASAHSARELMRVTKNKLKAEYGALSGSVGVANAGTAGGKTGGGTPKKKKTGGGKAANGGGTGTFEASGTPGPGAGKRARKGEVAEVSVGSDGEEGEEGEESPAKRVKGGGVVKVEPVVDEEEEEEEEEIFQ